ncbi:DinB family protein [Flavobacterium sp.]|uniref:DinB family protein n=1 Tax=Flavobacterium sp. TaxID=239 RepID=UPI0026363509|nr:DinB family protein [Flavobacterium sp.]
MNPTQPQNAVHSLLAEYKKIIIELQSVIAAISDADLIAIVDPETQNPDCQSIQTVLAHVVRSGYSYCVYIRNFRGIESTRPEKVNRFSALEYINDLGKVFAFTEETFATIGDNELEEYDNSKKILTAWGQLYDIEQLMEHAIVHVLRHRRQIEKFKSLLHS